MTSMFNLGFCWDSLGVPALGVVVAALNVGGPDSKSNLAFLFNGPLSLLTLTISPD